MGVPINYNLRNLIERKGTTLMTAIRIGLTVPVLVPSLALTTGLKTVFAGTGDPRQLIVLPKGADAELTSTVSNDTYQIIRRFPGIATDAKGEPLVSPEGLTVVNLPSVDSPTGMNVTVRGLLPIGVSLRNVVIEQGEMFKPGLRQIVVGESIARRYPDARIGKQVRFGRGLWEVVGVFKVGESASNSEIWVDLNQLRGDFEQQGGSSSLLIRADLPLDAAIAQAAVAEREYEKPVAARKAAVKANGGNEEGIPTAEDPLPPKLAEFRKLVADHRRRQLWDVQRGGLQIQSRERCHPHRADFCRHHRRHRRLFASLVRLQKEHRHHHARLIIPPVESDLQKLRIDSAHRARRDER